MHTINYIQILSGAKYFILHKVRNATITNKITILLLTSTFVSLSFSSMTCFRMVRACLHASFRVIDWKGEKYMTSEIFVQKRAPKISRRVLKFSVVYVSRNNMGYWHTGNLGPWTCALDSGTLTLHLGSKAHKKLSKRKNCTHFLLGIFFVHFSRARNYWVSRCPGHTKVVSRDCQVDGQPKTWVFWQETEKKPWQSKFWGRFSERKPKFEP